MLKTMLSDFGMADNSSEESTCPGHYEDKYFSKRCLYFITLVFKKKCVRLRKQLSIVKLEAATSK